MPFRGHNKLSVFEQIQVNGKFQFVARISGAITNLFTHCTIYPRIPEQITATDFKTKLMSLVN